MLEGVDDFYPLSPLQASILLQSLAATDHPELYFNQCLMDIGSTVDAAAMRRAWEQVVSRHPVLRTGFVWEGVAEPVQVVESEVDLPWFEHQQVRSSPEEQERAITDELERIRADGFDLARAPLIRVDLFALGEERFRLAWSFHHLLLDGWSAHLVLDEVLRLYDHELGVGSLRLGNPRPYRDFVVWAHERDRSAARAYWRSLLEDSTRVASPFAVDVDSASSVAVARESVQVALEDGELAALRKAAQRLRITPSTLVLLAWGVLLGRHHDRRDVVFGTVVSGRPVELDGYAEMVGLFIGTLPVRLRWSSGDRLSTVAHDLRDQLARLQDLPPCRLAEIAKWCAREAASPLVDTLVLFENYRKDRSIEAMSATLEIGRVDWFECVGFPASLLALPEGDRLVLRLLFDGSRLRRSAATTLLEQYTEVLRGTLAATDPVLDELPLLSSRSLERQIGRWTASRAPYPDDVPIDTLFRQIAASAIDAAALIEGDRTMTYRELDARSDRLAAALSSRNAGVETPVGLCFERSIEAVVAILGILKAGGAYVPLDPRDPPARIAQLLDAAAVDCVITDRRHRERLPSSTDQLLWEELEAASGSPPPAAGRTSDMLAYVMFTSGSTGEPKGVTVPHKAVVRLVRGTDFVRLGPEQVHLLLAPLTFDASTFEIWGALLNGAPLVIHPEPIPTAAGLARLVERHGITVLWLTAGLFHQLMEDRPDRLAGVDQLLAGGDVVQSAAVRRLLELPGERLFVNGYGPTENTTFSCCFAVREAARLGTTVPIGKAIANTTCYLLDDRFDPVPIGVAGELFVGGDGLARGYAGRPDLTAERFLPDPFLDRPGARMYRTGDLVRENPDGTIDFLGRLDRQIKIRGYRIEPGEIETVLSSHAAVRQAIVTTDVDARGKSRLVAYWLPDRSSVEPETLRRHLEERLPAHMLPAVFVRLDEVPLTRNGKVDYARLPAVPDRADGPAGRALPRSETEIAVAEIWRDLLGIGEIGLDENFFEAGGDSLLLLRLHRRLEDLCEREFRLVELFRFTTVRSMAAYLDGDDDGETEKPAAHRSPEATRRRAELAARRRRAKRDLDE